MCCAGCSTMSAKLMVLCGSTMSARLVVLCGSTMSARLMVLCGLVLFCVTPAPASRLPNQAEDGRISNLELLVNKLVVEIGDLKQRVLRRESCDCVKTKSIQDSSNNKNDPNNLEPPQILNSSQKLVLAVGDSFVLPCLSQDVDPVAPGSLVWKTQQRVLTSGSRKVTQDYRLQLLGGHKLQIRNIRRGDAGTYTCQITTNGRLVALTHTIEIKDPCFSYDIHNVGHGLHKPGSDNNYGPTGSALRCQQLCRSTRGCEWFNWERRKDQCWLKSDKGTTTVPRPGDVSGPKQCLNLQGLQRLQQMQRGQSNQRMAAVRGSHGYVEYHPGDMNLIIAAPHGGSLTPDSIPERQDDGSGEVNIKADSHTDDIAAGLAKHFFSITGRRPHLVLSNLHRSRLDPNREEDVAAQGNRQAVTAYREYHDLILQAMVAAAPPQLRISSTGRASQVQADRMGDYYLTAGLDHQNNYPVYKKVDNTQGVYVNDQGNWVVFSRVDSKMRSLRNVESGPASPSPPVRGWEFYDGDSSSWVSDPHLKVESLAPPYVTVSSSGAAASGQPARMGRYRLTSQNHNNHPVYKKEDDSQVMFLNDNGEWAVYERIDPKMRSLKSSAGATAIPPREGWQFWDRSSSSWADDSRLRVDTPTALLLDIHGQAHGKNSSELGYLLTKAELNAGRLSAEKTSIRGLIYRTGISIAQMLHGPKSLGAFFENAGYKAFPSPRQPSPGKDIYYRGGFTIQEHGSKDGGAVDAIQIEAPGEVRSGGGKKGRDEFTLALTHVAKNFYDQYYNNI